MTCRTTIGIPTEPLRAEPLHGLSVRPKHAGAFRCQFGDGVLEIGDLRLERCIFNFEGVDFGEKLCALPRSPTPVDPEFDHGSYGFEALCRRNWRW